MSAIVSLSIKQKDGKYKNYTISINDETNQYGQNVTMFESQTKEEREAKAPKKYIGNGYVAWTDGKIFDVVFNQKQKTNEVKQVNQVNESDSLPF